MICFCIFTEKYIMKEITDNIIAVKSKDFALRIIRLYKYLTLCRHEYV